MMNGEMNCQVSVYFQVDKLWIFVQNVINAGDFTIFSNKLTAITFKV